MPWAQTGSDLSSHLSLHTTACALVSACCSFLPPLSQRVYHELWDSPACPCLPYLPPHTLTLALVPPLTLPQQTVTLGGHSQP